MSNELKEQLEATFRKKLLLYIIRTTITVILCVVLWENDWVKWCLIAYIPLNIFSLYTILKWRSKIRGKVNDISDKINEL